MRRILVPFTHAFLADARVTAASALRGGADEVVAVAADGERVPLGAFAAGVRVLQPSDVGVEEERIAITAASHGTVATARSLMAEAAVALDDGDDATVLLMPGVRVVAPLAPLWAALEEHGSVVVPNLLHPAHSTVPERRMGLERRAPSAPVDILASPIFGPVSSMVLGVRGCLGSALLDGWPGRMGVISHFDALHGGQFEAWLEGMALAPGVHVLRDPGLPVGWFNLHERELSADGDRLLVDGVPLVLLDLRGHDPRRPNVLVPGTSIGFLSEHPALIPEVQTHAAELAAAGALEERAPGHLADHLWHQGRWATLPNGDEMVGPMRNLYRAMMADGDLSRSPFTPRGLDEMLAAFNQPGPRGKPSGMNRFVWSLWTDREYLRDAYPALEGPDGPGLIGWVWAYGREQELIPESVLPADAERFAKGHVGFVDPGDAPPGSRIESRRPGVEGVNVAGFFSTQLGLGESVRQLVRSLRSTGVPVTAVQGRVMPSGRGEAAFDYVTPDHAEHPVSVLMLNGDSITAFAGDVGEDFFRDRYTIGFYWWEVDPYPADAWDPALEYVDELWAGTEFVGDILRRGVDIPVSVVRVPVAEPPPVTVDRAHFGLPEDATLFAFVYDYESSGRRKNPLGLVNAYRAAFGPDDGTHLLLKSLGSVHRVVDHEEVLVAAAGRDDITIIDRYLTAEEKDSLVGICDCYVSPHRSEGFGYTLAEAMAYGKPVVCTGYGGVLDFVDETVARLVSWTPSITGPFAIPYPPDSRWCDPDEDDLARQLRWVHEHPEEAAAMGRRAKARIRETHSYAASGASMRQRLHEIYAALETRPADPAPAPVDGAPAKTTRRRVIDATLAVPVAGTAVRRARRSWWSIMDRAVISRTRPAFTDLRRQAATVEGAVRETERELATLRATLAERDARLVGLGQDVDHLATDLRGAREQAAQQAELARKMDDHMELHAPVPFGVVESGMTYVDSPYGRALHGDFRGEPGQEYGGFLARFRGDRERVRALAAPYGALLEGQGPVLDLGCGRGELLDVLTAAGLEARGVDLAPGLVADARERGLVVEEGDALAALQEAAEGSLGAVTALHVIEHLEADVLDELLVACRRALRPGGLVALETVNVYDMRGSATFWLDPTHRNPILPEALLAMVGAAGFAEGWVFAPDGTGDWEVDRATCSRYTVIARRP